jgi:hypothetical protein
MKTMNHGHTAPKSKALHHRLRHIHHSPLFWVGAVLFLVAIAMYIFSEDLTARLHLA